MTTRILEILQCPFCGGNYKYKRQGQHPVHGGFGFINCTCDTFPVVAGIPILQLRQIGSSSTQKDHLVTLIKNKDFIGALRSVIVPRPNIWQLIPPIIRRIPSIKGINPVRSIFQRRFIREWDSNVNNFIKSWDHNTTVEELLRFYFCLPGVERISAFDYFFYRFSQPRHLTTLGLFQIISKNHSPVLELNCGFGHMTRTLLNRISKGLVIGVDREFFPLYVAKNRIAPKGEYVCSDIDNGLPFQENAFRASVNVDGIHYVTNKVSYINETLRVSTNDALHLFISSRNQNIDYPYAGKPLTPEQYMILLKKLPNRVISDTTVIDSYLSKEALDIEKPYSFDSVQREPLISLIASNDRSVFKKYPYSGQWENYNTVNLSLNPLYKIMNNRNGSLIELELSYPNDFYKQDNMYHIQYLPLQIKIDRDIIENAGTLYKDPRVQSLIDSFVLIDLPSNYSNHKI
jgi:uncharacterized protein YbaR (Trm112 family)